MDVHRSFRQGGERVRQGLTEMPRTLSAMCPPRLYHGPHEQQEEAQRRTAECDLQPPRVPCVFRVLILEFMVVVVQVGVRARTQAEPHVEVRRDRGHKQQTADNVQ